MITTLITNNIFITNSLQPYVYNNHVFFAVDFIHCNWVAEFGDNIQSASFLTDGDPDTCITWKPFSLKSWIVDVSANTTSAFTVWVVIKNGQCPGKFVHMKLSRDDKSVNRQLYGTCKNVKSTNISKVYQACSYQCNYAQYSQKHVNDIILNFRDIWRKDTKASVCETVICTEN